MSESDKVLKTFAKMFVDAVNAVMEENKKPPLPLEPEKCKSIAETVDEGARAIVKSQRLEEIKTSTAEAGLSVEQSAEPVTLKDLGKLVGDLSTAAGKPHLNAIGKKYCTKKLSEVPEERWPELYIDLKTALQEVTDAKD